jgi:hypothetical protein
MMAFGGNKNDSQKLFLLISTFYFVPGMISSFSLSSSLPLGSWDSKLDTRRWT